MGKIGTAVRRMTRGGLLLREVRGVRRELARIATALETYNAHQWSQQIQGDPAVPPVEVTYVDTQVQAEFLEIELGLTQAKGTPPTEDQILAEWFRRHPESATPEAPPLVLP